jgi:phosphate transport system ATP-binding protein
MYKDQTQFPIALEAQNVSVSYNNVVVLEQVNLPIYKHQITGLIGRSGCGKSTFLRCFNRLHELIKSAQMEGNILLEGENISDHRFNPVEIRRRIGMVFQRPNPFPKSIYDNIAIGLRVNGFRGEIDERIEIALKQVGLWDEVKNDLRKNALSLSGGQQQRLCLARAIALQPEVLLMDEPTSALDPISTLRVEDLLHDLKKHYTIVMVTHDLKQASRLADYVAYFDVKTMPTGHLVGHLVEYDRTEIIFQKPQQRATIEYVTGNHYKRLLR